MQQVIRINAIQKRAAVIGLTLTDLCREAHCQVSTVHRWKTGEVDPRLSHFEETVAKLEAALATHEERVRQELAGGARRNGTRN